MTLLAMAYWPFLAFFALECVAVPFGIPPSSSTVDVRAFNVANFTSTTPGTIIQPILPGHETSTIPFHAFLVEHSGKRLMFDLGMRSDYLNLVPSISSGFQSGQYSVEPFKDITELLEEGGIPLESIETVIWSHSHFDHIGDMSKFPNSTGLVIGPGTNRSLYPEFPDAILQASDLAGHKVTELDFNTTTLTFSGLPALDYFGDGSFYLLDTPGHLDGHVTAIARVTPTSFVVLGADTGHHIGQFRPRPRFQQSYPCPHELVTESKTAVSTQYFWSSDSSPEAFDVLSRTQPFLTIPDQPGGYQDPVTARVSLDKVAGFDADDDFFVVLAHDLSLLEVLPYFPASLSAWKGDKVKDDAVWGFMDVENPAFRFGPT